MNLDKILKDIKDIFLSLFLIFCCLVVGEAAMRLFWPQPNRTIYLDGQPMAFVDKETGLSLLRPGARWKDEKSEFTTTYEINQQGFRDKIIHQGGKQKGVLRILILGSSTTLGAGVTYEEMWPTVFERELIQKGYRVDVIKAGMNAFSTSNTVVLLEKLWPQYQPDIVMMEFPSAALFANAEIIDSAAPMSGQEQPLEANAMIARVDKQKKELYLSTLIKRVIRLNDLIFTDYNMKKGWGPIFYTDSDFRHKQIAVTEGLFFRAQKFCSSKGASLVILALPECSQMLMQANNIRIEGIDPLANDVELARFSRDHEIQWSSSLIPLAEYYRQSKKELFYRLDGHLNSRGHQILGSLAADKVIAVIQK